MKVVLIYINPSSITTKMVLTNQKAGFVWQLISPEGINVWLPYFCTCLLTKEKDNRTNVFSWVCLSLTSNTGNLRHFLTLYAPTLLNGQTHCRQIESKVKDTFWWSEGRSEIRDSSKWKIRFFQMNNRLPLLNWSVLFFWTLSVVIERSRWFGNKVFLL